MVSISHVVEDIVKHRPYLSESLAAGIINVSSLARQLQPDVERALQKGVNTGAIVMALNRLAPYLQVREQVQLNKLLSNMGDIILRSSLCDYTFKNSPTLLDCHIEVLKNLVKNDEIFYIKALGRNMHIMTKLGEINSRQYTMKSLNDILSGSFERCHKSFLVNKKYIQSVNPRTKTLHLRGLDDDIPYGKDFHIE